MNYDFSSPKKNTKMRKTKQKTKRNYVTRDEWKLGPKYFLAADFFFCFFFRWRFAWRQRKHKSWDDFVKHRAWRRGPHRPQEANQPLPRIIGPPESAQRTLVQSEDVSSLIPQPVVATQPCLDKRLPSHLHPISSSYLLLSPLQQHLMHSLVFTF